VRRGSARAAMPVSACAGLAGRRVDRTPESTGSRTRLEPRDDCRPGGWRRRQTGLSMSTNRWASPKRLARCSPSAWTP
ncbi:MAG: hypothetical protein ACK559_03495, partial [bacterium]